MDDCGLATYAFPLVEVARAYALLADPSRRRRDPVRAAMAPALTRVRDAMTGAPEMVGGTDGSLDTMLMQHLKGRSCPRAAPKGCAAWACCPGLVAAGVPPSVSQSRIDDGDGFARANRAVTMEALTQLGRDRRSSPRGTRVPSIDPSPGRRRRHRRGDDPRLPAGADLRAGLASAGTACEAARTHIASSACPGRDRRPGQGRPSTTGQALPP